MGTAFLTIGPKTLNEGGIEQFNYNVADDQIDATTRAFLGLTAACARCHDHKYDPISTRDYYALAGIFKSTKTMESLKTIAKWHEHSFATPAHKELKKK